MEESFFSSSLCQNCVKNQICLYNCSIVHITLFYTFSLSRPFQDFLARSLQTQQTPNQESNLKQAFQQGHFTELF